MHEDLAQKLRTEPFIKGEEDTKLWLFAQAIKRKNYSPAGRRIDGSPYGSSSLFNER